MKKSLVFSSILVAFSTIANAEEFIDSATVIFAEPIIEESYTEPYTKCESVSYYRSNSIHQEPSYAGQIIGGIAGGILGHQVGKGSGKEIATATGAMIGAIVGNNIDNNNSTIYNNVQLPQCHTTYRTKHQITWWNVTYQYHGRVMHRIMSNKPGRTIQVRVIVEPVGGNAQW